MMIILNDVTEAYQAYAEWVSNGKENEDLGDSLKEELVDSLQGFLFLGGQVNEANVAFTNANSDLDVKITGSSISIEIPESGDEDDYTPLIVSGY
jgi:hypothetical protein